MACIAFTVMYPLMEKNEEVKNGFQWWLSKAGVMAVISVLQAVVMVGVLMGVNGMRPDYVGKTFGMAILASMAFMAMICFFEMFINRLEVIWCWYLWCSSWEQRQEPIRWTWRQNSIKSFITLCRLPTQFMHSGIRFPWMEQSDRMWLCLQEF